MPRTEPTPDTAGFAVREAFLALGGTQRSASILRWISDHYPNRWDDRTIGSHLRGCSVNNPIGIRHHRHFPRFLFKAGHGEFHLYDATRDGNFDESGYGEGVTAEDIDPAEELRALTEEIESRNEFAYEAHLRDYLARNLHILGEPLQLWTGDLEGSVEFQIDGRRIDILAKDRQGTPVVIELKLSRGHERTIGQALYYRGKLRQLLGVPRIRIIMIAGEISEELKIASAEVRDVEVFSYALTMKVQKIATDLLA